jgi:hypothetical protein
MTSGNYMIDEIDFVDYREAVRFFESVPWGVLRGMRGNPHSSIIGLLSEWWITMEDPNWVLDGPPTAGNRRVADILMGSSNAPRIVVEVEGTRHVDKLESLRLYLDSEHDDLSSVSVGVLASYAYPPDIPNIPRDEIVEAARSVSARLGNKWLVLVELQKVRVEVSAEVMNRSDYYKYAFNHVEVGPMRGGSFAGFSTVWQA